MREPIAAASAHTHGSTFCPAGIVAIQNPPSNRDLDSIPRRLATIRADTPPPSKRLADNMLDANPAATDSLVRLMWGALVPDARAVFVNARVRYFRSGAAPPECPRMWPARSGLTNRRT